MIISKETILKIKSKSVRQGYRICAKLGIDYMQLVKFGEVVQKPIPDIYEYSKGEWV